ncbi:hypothetical protein EXIGLDRAFT_735562 [Exidia glandulosa HHB12029]|uniref:Uncharacterized protein n=1 Tax=Exidia glandulosa HHB12029 TaxID=1314781 RepID=A0A165JS93_EXIGL|nr:hypothetical protein EXIGLDRAFT_735562 [Exidia glandulosa HHB12029]
MPRGQKKKNKDDASWETPGASQGSDDAVMTAAIVKQMESKWDKSRKSAEGKLDKAIVRDLDAALDARKQNYERATADIAAAYDAFLLDYAVIEDQIRQTWLQIGSVLESRLTHSEGLAQRHAATEETREEEQYHAFAHKSNAVQVVDRQIRSLREIIEASHS